MNIPSPDIVCLASWNVDLVSRVPRPVARGETLMASSFDISPGGKGSNAAVAAARQGARVAVLARIGDDDFGRMAQHLWAAEGIHTNQVEVAHGERSGVAQIQVFDDGDNSIAVYRGAGAGLDVRHVRSASPLLQACRVVMAPNEVPAACTEEAFSIARSAGAQTVLNPAPAQALSDNLLRLVDVLTPNESELLSMAGGRCRTLDEAATALLSRGVGAVVVTLGAAGCRLFRPGMQPPLSIPGWRVKVVDTIGAGDTLTGALSAALARGEDLASAVAWANAAAALSVQGRGAINGVPDLAATRRLREHGALATDGHGTQA
ncbi:MAG: ribokinase [Rubrivivax sp.]|nr:ribokinase [Rubrivivax sp.]